MPKPLVFKGDKKPKKRKRAADADDALPPSSKELVNTTGTPNAETEDDDSWVNADSPNDISGPVLIVLPSEPPTCIACDLNGKVFASSVENFVEGDPSTAEPHDTRQVWVANRVAGTESFSFKSNQGRYLGCDKYGVLSATNTAISPEESILCIPVPNSPSTFSLQTQRDTFFKLDESSKRGPEIRGDADTISFSTTFRIRMQARFKPKLKAAKEEKVLAKISRKELEEKIGRRLKDDEVRTLKRARREGNFHEVALDMKVKDSHDKFAS
ncbi:actin-crosslinking protein [Polyplosphaeria fusca]|uniref:Actin-crosslinking protein n=1 Tax=Polyplosphaeria fusca TaxID=682080 RepID=A0A9P4R5I3_9PLEO|nr:actin-crosslinking protein [Polyplosphaeria fusca]